MQMSKKHILNIDSTKEEQIYEHLVIGEVVRAGLLLLPVKAWETSHFRNLKLPKIVFVAE